MIMYLGRYVSKQDKSCPCDSSVDFANKGKNPELHSPKKA